MTCFSKVVNGRSVKDGHDDVEPSLSKRPKVDFVPRPSEIVTKNCTKLDQSVKVWIDRNGYSTELNRISIVIYSFESRTL